MSGPRRLGRPRAAEVRVDAHGLPARVGAAQVESLIEDWVVEDRWWTERPVRRRYVELALENGRCVLVFKDLIGGRWYTQRG